MSILKILLSIAILSVLVIIHELGHYLTAKRNGVEVEEFGLGFPPKVWGKTMGRGIMRCYYSLNLLPLGGFVRLKGETTSDKRPGSFGAASLWVKSKITYAGVAMNLLAAVVLLSIVAAIKMPVVFDNQFMVSGDSEIVTDRIDITFVAEDSVADDLGLEPGDQLLTINEQAVSKVDEVSQLLEQRLGQTAALTVFDYSTQSEFTYRADLPDQTDSDGGILGVGLQRYQEFRATWSAPIVGVVTTLQFSWETLALLGNMVTDLFQGDFESASSGVAGPVGIFYVFSQANSLSMILLLSGIISLSLAVMNFLPIPALDGGRMAVTYIYHALDRELTADREEAIHGAGMVLLLALIALITVVDVQRFF